MTTPKTKDDIGIWLANAGRFPRLSLEETNLLSRRIQELPEGDPVRPRLVNKLVERNLRLVAHIVRGYLNGGHSNRKWGCSETVDFLQVGTIGLVRAAEMYDPTKGYTFATYANHWIRSKVIRYGIKTRGLVHVSETMCRAIISYNRNGFIRSRKTKEKLPNSKVVPMLREAEVALACSSLNALDEYGKEVVRNIPNPPGEDPDLACSIDAALKAAGVGEMGRRLLVLIHGHDCTKTEAASMLGIGSKRLRSELDRAMLQARESKELAELLC